jgi:hypothetical protein
MRISRYRYRKNPLIAKAEDTTIIIGVGVAAIVIYWLYQQGAAIAATASTALNPANPSNIVNQGANATFQAVTGNTVDSLGTWVYGILNPIGYDPNAPTSQIND